MRDKFLVIKLIKTEAVPTLHLIVVVLNVSYHTWTYLQLNILSRCILLVVLVERLEVLSYDRSMWNDIRTKLV